MFRYSMVILQKSDSAGLFLKGTSNSIVAHQYKIFSQNVFCSRSIAQIEAAVHSMRFISMTISWRVLFKGPLIRGRLSSVVSFPEPHANKNLQVSLRMNQSIGLCATWIIYIFRQKNAQMFFQSHVFLQFISLNKLSSLGGEINCRTESFLGLVIATQPDNFNKIRLVFS